jgi:hypothetical protein
VDPNPHPDADPHHFGKLDLTFHSDADPDLHPHQFADDKPKNMEYELILAFFQGFEPVFGSWYCRLWIWIRIKVKTRIRIRIRIGIKG